MTRLRIFTICILLAAFGEPALAEQQASRTFAPVPSTSDTVVGPGELRVARIQALVDLTYPHQSFDVRLDLPGGHGVLTGDRRFEITAWSAEPAVLLLLNVDQTGIVSVLYPTDDREQQPTTSLRETFEVVPPYGTEYLKLFAFRRPPEGLDRWIHRRIDAQDADFDQLLHLLREPGVDGAQARLKVVTVDESMND